MTGQKAVDTTKRDREPSRFARDCSSPGADAPESPEMMLRLLEAIRTSNHELNNILTAAHCLVDLLAVPQPAAIGRKYIDTLRTLLNDIAVLGNSLRREGNAAQRTLGLLVGSGLAASLATVREGETTR